STCRASSPSAVTAPQVPPSTSPARSSAARSAGLCACTTRTTSRTRTCWPISTACRRCCSCCPDTRTRSAGRAASAWHAVRAAGRGGCSLGHQCKKDKSGNRGEAEVGCPICLCDAYGHKIGPNPGERNGVKPHPDPPDVTSIPYSPSTGLAHRIIGVTHHRRSTPLMTTLPAWKRMALLAVLGVVLLGAYTWAFHEFIVTGPVDAIAMDFYARYEPTRLYLTEGLNPYSDEATQIVHRGIYGDDHVKLEPQHAFFYPMYTMLIIAPYTLLPAFSWAQAAWQVTLQVLLIASLLLTLDFLNWRPRLQVIILLGLWTFVLFPVTHSLVLGQFSVVTF